MARFEVMEIKHGRAAMLGFLHVIAVEARAKYEGYPNVGDAEAGDIAGIPWVRYDDPETKTFKLNAERQNARAAMLGITGCLLHELLGVDALYPTGGLGGAAPPTIF